MIDGGILPNVRSVCTVLMIIVILCSSISISSYVLIHSEEQVPMYSSVEKALLEAHNFLRKYMPEAYSIIDNNDLEPTIIDRSGTWYSSLALSHAYRIMWSIDYPVESDDEPDTRINISLEIITNHHNTSIYSIEITSDTPTINNVLGIEERLLTTRGINSPLVYDIESLKEYIISTSRNMPRELVLTILSNSSVNKTYILTTRHLNTPIYAYHNGELIPLISQVTIGSNRLIFKNPLVLIKNYVTEFSMLDKPRLNTSDAMRIINDRLLGVENIRVRRNLELIALIDTNLHSIGLYYYSSYIINNRYLHTYLINAYTGELLVKEKPLDNTVYQDNYLTYSSRTNGIPTFLLAITLFSAIASIALIVFRRKI